MSTQKPDTTFYVFLSFLHRAFPPIDFAHWLYTDETIHHAVEREWYDRLVEIDYYNHDRIQEVDILLMNILQTYRPALYEEEYTRTLLCQLVLGTIDLFHACSKLAQRYHQGYDWIPIIFVGIDSELQAASSKDESWVAQYEQLAKQEAQKLLHVRFPGIACSNIC